MSGKSGLKWNVQHGGRWGLLDSGQSLVGWAQGPSGYVVRDAKDSVFGGDTI